MSANSKIEWTDHTFNPWIGCTKVSPACDHCYAERSTPSRTLGVAWGPGAPRRRTGESNWELPKRWNAQAEAFAAQHGRRQRVFCASLADVFDNEVPVEWRVNLFRLIRLTPELDWLLLTKRIGNLMRLVREAFDHVAAQPGSLVDPLFKWLAAWCNGAPPSNVWVGASICNQPGANRDIPKLKIVPARVRFLSIEPLLGPVDLTDIPLGSGHGHHEFDPIITGNALQRADHEAPHVHWVIVGGESGPHARPMHPDWARSLRDQCQAAGVPFLFKQWGEWLPCETDCCGDGNWYGTAEDGSDRDLHELNRSAAILTFDDGQQMARVGKKAAGRLLDGRTWNEVPE